MPKHGFLTPKAIANRIKSKGLQKLRWYCQMCQKQCRDENGFKCHTSSESHQRQLLLFAESPDKYINQFSQEFLDDFMQLMKRRFGTKRVHSNQVYQEYIADRNHLHMNATQWETLTDFVKWLGREGHCIADETEKGWFISYIDRDPETIRRQETLMKHEKMRLDDEERMANFFQRQLEKDREQSKPKQESVFTELKKTSEDDKVAFTMKCVDKSKKLGIEAKQNPLAMAVTSKTDNANDSKIKNSGIKKRKLVLEEVIEQEKAIQERKNQKDYWLLPGIIVKVVSRKLGEEFYKKKVVVADVQDNYYAIIQTTDSGEKTVAHQKQVETVIPNVGRKVMILNGTYRGCEAVLLHVNYETFSVKVKISAGSFKGKVLDFIRYENVSKLQIQT